MTLELLIQLAALALVDSLSVGTLLIPVFFLIAPRLRAGRMVTYLLTIAAFYLMTGIALMLGATAALAALQGVLESTVGYTIQLVLGVALLVGSFLIPTKPREGRAPGRLTRWRDAALDGPGLLAVVGVALGAGLVELATMVPYLGAVGLMSAADIDVATRVGLLAGYCVVMIAPALVLLTLRLLARSLVEPPLRRLAAWLERTGAETTAWVIGIVGFLLARDAIVRLGLLDGVWSATGP